MFQVSWCANTAWWLNRSPRHRHDSSAQMVPDVERIVSARRHAWASTRRPLVHQEGTTNRLSPSSSTSLTHYISWSSGRAGSDQASAVTSHRWLSFRPRSPAGTRVDGMGEVLEFIPSSRSVCNLTRALRAHLPQIRARPRCLSLSSTPSPRHCSPCSHRLPSWS